MEHFARFHAANIYREPRARAPMLPAGRGAPQPPQFSGRRPGAPISGVRTPFPGSGQGGCSTLRPGRSSVRHLPTPSSRPFLRSRAVYTAAPRWTQPRPWEGRGFCGALGANPEASSEGMLLKVTRKGLQRRGHRGGVQNGALQAPAYRERPPQRL